MDGEEEEVEKLDQEETVIWGTTVNTHECTERFKDFLQDFRPMFINPGDPPSSYYLEKIREMHEEGKTTMDLLTTHLYSHTPSRRLYMQLKQYPQEVIPLMDEVVTTKLQQLILDSSSLPIDGGVNDEAAGMVSIQVKPCKLREVSLMRQLNPEDIDQLVCIRGMVTRCSPPIPEIKQALFECSVCGYEVPSIISRGKITEPNICDLCNRSNSMTLNFNRSYYSDKQLIRLQEDIDETPAGIFF